MIYLLGNTKDRVQESSQYKPPSRHYTTEEQDKYEEEEDLRSPWKQKSYEGSAVHSKQPFGKDRYHSKNTHESLSAKKPSRPVLDKDEYSENSQESQKPYYQVTSNHPDFPTKHQHVNMKGPVRPGNPVKEVAKEPTEEKATTHNSDDVDRELERKLEELMPKTDTQQYQPSGGDTKAVPTTAKPTFHQWRQFVDNNPNFPYTIPSEVEHPLEQAVEKQTEKPVEKPVQKKPVEIPAQKQVDVPVQKLVEVPVQKPVQVPEQRPVQVPVQRPVEETVQKVPVQKKPIEVPVQKKPVEVPLLKPVEKPIQTQVPKPWQEPTEPEKEPPKPTEPIIITEKARVHDGMELIPIFTPPFPFIHTDAPFFTTLSFPALTLTHTFLSQPLSYSIPFTLSHFLPHNLLHLNFHTVLKVPSSLISSLKPSHTSSLFYPLLFFFLSPSCPLSLQLFSPLLCSFCPSKLIVFLTPPLIPSSAYS